MLYKPVAKGFQRGHSEHSVTFRDIRGHSGTLRKIIGKSRDSREQ